MACILVNAVMIFVPYCNAIDRPATYSLRDNLTDLVLREYGVTGIITWSIITSILIVPKSRCYFLTNVTFGNCDE